AIPGVHGGAGHDQIPHTGQAAEGLPGAPQLLPQAGNLRHSPGHQQGFGIVLIAQTVAHTAAEGNDVLQRRRQLHAHDVAAGVHPEVVVHEGVLHKTRRIHIQAGGHAAGGQADPHLLCMGRARKNCYFTDIPRLLLDHLAETQICVPLNPLGNGHHHSLLREIR
ncbi:DUF6487 domain-containing protein, partial [Dysosmobacter welbionis]